MAIMEKMGVYRARTFGARQYAASARFEAQLLVWQLGEGRRYGYARQAPRTARFILEDILGYARCVIQGRMDRQG